MTGAERGQGGLGGDRGRRRWLHSHLLLPAGVIIIVGVAILAALYGPRIVDRIRNGESGDVVRIRMNIDGAVGHPTVRRQPSGNYVVELDNDDGTTTSLSPQAFLDRVYRSQAERPWWRRLFNISTAANVLWVGLGLLGQVLFTGRMIVQWITSERSGRSTVPVAFWWMSLIGATMLMIYFIWRKDIVGVLGQGTGWLIYVRNLVLIYKVRPEGLLDGGDGGVDEPTEAA